MQGSFSPGLGWVQFWAKLPVPVPSISVYLQAFILDPGEPHGFAATNGLEVVID